MLTEKPWRPYAVVRLALELFVSICIGSLLMTSLNYLFPKVTTDYQKLCNIVIWVGSFHGVVLVLIARFLREHQMTWDAAFGFASSNRILAIGLGVVAIALTLNITQWLGHISHA